MSYFAVAFEFFRKWFLPSPAHDDPRFVRAEDQEEAEFSNQELDTDAPPSPTVQPAEIPQDEEPAEEVYGERPMPDPSITEDRNNDSVADDQDEYDTEAERDFALGEPDENRDSVSDVDYGDTAAENEASPTGDPAADPQPETTSEPSEQLHDQPVKKASPLPVNPPEGAEARASRAHSRVNPFEPE